MYSYHRFPQGPPPFQPSSSKTSSLLLKKKKRQFLKNANNKIKIKKLKFQDSGNKHIKRIKKQIGSCDICAKDLWLFFYFIKDCPTVAQLLCLSAQHIWGLGVPHLQLLSSQSLKCYPSYWVSPQENSGGGAFSNCRRPWSRSHKPTG